MTDFVAIDFETTGFAGDGSNDPWQLGIAVVQGGEIVDTREFFFGTAVTPDAETMMAQWDEWYPLLAGRRLVAHNIATERTILRKNAPLTKWGPWVDTLKLARARYPKLPSYSLGDLCGIFGQAPQLGGRTWHDALYDAVACARLALFLSVG